MEEEFNLRLLRISIIQILKAHGFEKCKPSTLNVMTDLYVKMLTHLMERCNKFAMARNDTINTFDILQGMVDSGLIKDNKDDIYNTKSIEGFRNWLDSVNFQTAKQINQVPINLKQIIIENRKFKNVNYEEEERQRRLKKKQEFFSKFGQQIDDVKINEFDNDNDNDNEEEINIDINWIDYLLEKDNKFVTRKFENTSLKPNTETKEVGDYLIDSTTDFINNYLPINVQYNAHLDLVEPDPENPAEDE